MGNILWLASYPKSGNTWLRAFLANYLGNSAAGVDINDLHKFAPNEASRSYFERVSTRPIEALDDKEVHRLRPRVHRLLADAAGRTAFLKTHSALTRLDGIATITPEATAGAIYVVRNPLDVAASFMAFFGAPADEVVAALNYPGTDLPTDEEQVVQHLGKWGDHVTGWTQAPGLRRLVLRYEDMMRAPDKTFAQAVAFLALPEDAARRRRAIGFSSFDVLSGQERAHGFSERPGKAGAPFFRHGKLGGYRGALTDDQIQRLIDCHAAVMRKFGYLSSDGRLSY